MEQKKQGRARVKLAVFCVLAVQGVGLLALLMQGCRREDKDAQSSAEATNTNVPGFEATAIVADSTSIPATALSPSNTVVTPVVDPNVATAATEYTVKAGDNFTTIGRNFHVSAKAIAEANPAVEATKLKVGQTLHIPAPVAAVAAPAPTTPTAETASTDGTYKVQSGDTLSKIATNHHITVRALRAANNLRTDSIKVGQVLKIPVASSSGATVATNPISTAPR